MTVSEDVLRSGQQVSRPPVQGSVWDNVLQQIYEASNRPALSAPRDVKSYLPQIYSPAVLATEIYQSSQASQPVKYSNFLLQWVADWGRYEQYVQRKQRQNKTPRGFFDWKVVSDYYRNNSPMARGNRFDKKAVKEKWYDFHQVHLANGKRLDSYDVKKQCIVSRKAIDLSKINLKTFERYLKEFHEKYKRGTVIRTNKYRQIDGTVLEGKYYLEIPESNKDFPDLQKFINLAREYDVEIIFKPE